MEQLSATVKAQSAEKKALAEDLEGEGRRLRAAELDIEDLKGRWVLLQDYTSACMPCAACKMGRGCTNAAVGLLGGGGRLPVVECLVRVMMATWVYRVL